MADDRIDVKFGATTEELKAGQDRAVGIVTQGSAQMRDRFRDLTSSTQQSMTLMQGAVQTGLGQITSLFTGFGKIAALALGTLAGGALFKSAIDSTKDFVGEAKKLKVVLGDDINEAAALIYAYKRVGVSADEVQTAIRLLNRQIKTNEEGINSLGVSTRDVNGVLRDQKTIFFEGLDKLREYKEGIDRNQAAMVLFGGRAGNVSGLLKIVSKDVDNAKKFLADLGMEIGPELEKQLKLFRAGMVDSNMVMTAMQFQVASQLLPVLNTLNEWFSDNGPLTIRVLIGALRGIEMTLIQVQGFFAALRDVAEYAWERIKISTRSGVDITSNLLRGDLIGALEAAQRGFDDLAKAAENYADRVQDRIKDLRFQEGMVGSKKMGRDSPFHALFGVLPEKGTDDEDKTFGDPKGTGRGGGGRLQRWQEELERIKIEENAFLDFSKAREKEYWQDKLTQCREGSNEYLQVRRRLFQLDKDLAKDAVDQKVAQIRLEQEQEKTSWAARLAGEDRVVALMAEKYGRDSRNYSKALMDKQRLQNQYEQAMLRHQEKLLDHEKSLAQIDIDIERDRLQFEESMGAISGSRKIALEMQLAQESYQLEKANLQKLLLLNKDYEDKVRELKKQGDILDKKHSQEMIRLSHQRTLALKADWQSFVSGGIQQFKGAVWSWISGSQTFGQAFSGMLMGLGQLFLDIIFQMIEQWLLALIFGTATTTSQIKADAGRAYAAAYASICAIPVVGPAMAPTIAAAAAAAALAGGMSFVASAARGWDVDRDALAYVHKSEMILPPDLAGGVRDLIRGDRSPAPPQHIRLIIPVTNEIKADGKTLLQQHKRLVFDIVQEGINHRVLRVKS